MTINFLHFFIFLIVCSIVHCENHQWSNGTQDQITRIKRTLEINPVLNFDFDLSVLGLFRTAINIWETPSIEKEIIKLLKEYHTNEPNFDNEHELTNDWSKHILDELDNLEHIPYSLKNQISYVIRPLGEEMVTFLKKTYNNLLNTEYNKYPSIYDYVEKVVWNSHGKIDEEKTFLKIFNNRQIGNKSLNYVFLFLEACRYCLERPIITLWNECHAADQRKILTSINNNFIVRGTDGVREIPSFYILQNQYLLYYWKWYFKNQSLPILQSEVVVPDFYSDTTILSMTLVRAIDKNNIPAVKYLLGQSFDAKQTKFILRHCINSLLSQTKSSYLDDMLIFLLQRIPSDMFNELFKEQGMYILDLFIRSWPGRYLFMNVLDAGRHYITPKNYHELFGHLVRKIFDEYTLLGRSTRTSIWLLKEFLDNNSHFFRDGVIDACWSLPISEDKKLTVISFISTFPDFENSITPETRKMIVRGFTKIARHLFINEKFDVITGFVNHFFNDGERNEFSQKVNIGEIHKGLFRTAINIWETPSIEKEIIKLLKEYHTNEPNFDNEHELTNDWSKHILDELDNLEHIPYSLRNQISYVIRPIGEEMVMFLKKTYKSLSNAGDNYYPSIYDYVEKIVWHSHGKINEEKTFIEIFNSRQTGNKPLNHVFLFLEACKHCLEQPIKTLWYECDAADQRKILGNINHNFMVGGADVVPEIPNFYNLGNQYLLYYWRWHFKNEHLYILQSELVEPDFYSDTTILSTTLVRAIERKNIPAVKYLLGQSLDSKQTKIVLRQGINSLLSQTKSSYLDDMLIFLLQRIPSDMFNEIFQEQGMHILDIFIHSWPGRYIFINVLDAGRHDITPKNYHELFGNLVRKIFEEYTLLGRSTRTSIWLLKEFLDNCSHYFRDGVIDALWLLPISENKKLTVISFIAKFSDFENSITARTRKMIVRGFTKIARLLFIDEKFDVITGFVNHFFTDDERNEFSQKINIGDIHKSLLLNSDDDDDYKKFKNLIEWNKQSKSTLSSQLFNEMIKSDKKLKKKYNAFVEWHNKEYPHDQTIVAAEKSMFERIQITARNYMRG
ncbi:hypothetical protein HCN44_005082 [Aphidius gifuensis]|uniref:Uncharacterized protein n=1 Tax=Aphidius gifuensis TaxID=684658 RepID=A0A834XUH9_APHGI|nr:hypothetical protein HCN44_005082 [Aphidius gifuensis]